MSKTNGHNGINGRTPDFPKIPNFPSRNIGQPKKKRGCFRGAAAVLLLAAGSLYGLGDLIWVVAS